MSHIHSSQHRQRFDRHRPESQAAALHQTEPTLRWRAQFNSLQVPRCEQENHLHHPRIPAHRLSPSLDPRPGAAPALCRRHECHCCGLEPWGNNSHLQQRFQKLQKSCRDSQETYGWNVGKLNVHTMILMHRQERAQRKCLNTAGHLGKEIPRKEYINFQKCS